MLCANALQSASHFEIQPLRYLKFSFFQSTDRPSSSCNRSLDRAAHRVRDGRRDLPLSVVITPSSTLSSESVPESSDAYATPPGACTAMPRAGEWP